MPYPIGGRGKWKGMSCMMEWKKLLSARRIGNYAKNAGQAAPDLRSEFEKDYHRIIGSASFRRLQDKTQVFALDKSDFIRTRLTHSLEVSSFAKSLGQNVAEYLLSSQLDPDFLPEYKLDICDVLQCAGLIHDIGNPPFGHFGEVAIRDWFRQNMPMLSWQGRPLTEVLSNQMLQDFYHFEGNAQALRQVTKLHFLVNEYGMNLTCALLDTIIKYPVSSEGIEEGSGRVSRQKMGFFYAEQSLYERISRETGAVGVRHPLTFLLEAADDIAYRTADIEDAFKKGFLSYDTLLTELVEAQEEAGGLGFVTDPAQLDPAAMLRHQYQNAKDRKVNSPYLYAIQNFLVRIQSAFINQATANFIRNYREIMAGTYDHDLFWKTPADWAIRALGDIAYRHAFLSSSILSQEVTAGTILNDLLNKYIPALIHYDTGVCMPIMDQKLIALISDNYLQTYHCYAGRTDCGTEKLYLRLLLATDNVTGMTDSYARELYRKLNGMN